MESPQSSKWLDHNKCSLFLYAQKCKPFRNKFLVEFSCTKDGREFVSQLFIYQVQDQ
jgi:hypothetical protein